MPKTTPFRELKHGHTAGSKERIARLKAEMEEEMRLEQLREALDLTQVRLAKLLGTSQANVSRLEKQNDMLLSTLRDYIRALGGELVLSVRIGGGSVRLKGISDLRRAV